MYGAPCGSNKKYIFQSTTNVGSSKDYKVFEIIQIGPRIEKTEPSKRYKGQITRRRRERKSVRIIVFFEFWFGHDLVRQGVRGQSKLGII